MRRIGPAKAALAVGSIVGLWHLLWISLVGVGWAKPVMDFILRLHFIKMQYQVAPFEASKAAALVLLTFAIGGLFGLLFALVWNWLGLQTGPGFARDTGRVVAEIGVRDY